MFIGSYHFLIRFVLQDFEDIPDLDGDYNPHYHVDLGSNLGVMTSQEKMEKFLNTSQ